MPVDHYELQRLDAEDISALVALEKEVSAFPWPAAHYASSLAGGDELWGLVHTESVGDEESVFPRLMGFFVLSSVLDEASLLNICIAASLQGQGLGGTLLRECIQRCRQRGMSRLLLEVRAANHRAIALYARYGFQLDGRRKQYYPAADGREDALLFSLALPADKA